MAVLKYKNSKERKVTMKGQGQSALVWIILVVLLILALVVILSRILGGFL